MSRFNVRQLPEQFVRESGIMDGSVALYDEEFPIWERRVAMGGKAALGGLQSEIGTLLFRWKMASGGKRLGLACQVRTYQQILEELAW